MHRPSRTSLQAWLVVVGLFLAGVLAAVFAQTAGPHWKLLAWNNLGMHCMDDSFEVFVILPPYNTFDAQLIDPNGDLIQDPTGITVSYEAVADPDGSINSTSIGKTDFWSYVQALFGVSLAPDVGLEGFAMPGAGNQPQMMAWNGTFNWFEGAGVPIAPIDNNRLQNSYPLMRIVARDAIGNLLAYTDTVLPVSVEMDCRACHGSGSGPAAKPEAGWVNDPNPSRDYRLNILRLHDEHHLGETLYDDALATNNYDPDGMVATVMGGTPILCARCHLSEALPGSGLDDIPPLTRAVHSKHAAVISPVNGMSLDDITNRTSCYQCHPGSDTRCLRGAMGAAVASDGSLAMQCQSCHGDMTRVGSATRTGWFDEPNCQSCHTGTALSNNGQIRFTTVFNSLGDERIAVNNTFATNPDTPVPGHSLYRFSRGHGGLQCSACHGSTHAIYPTSHRNDNIASFAQQGHVGTISECSACHLTVPGNPTGGPHGMHPVGQAWLNVHKEYGKNVNCQACHGTDYRGTVLSRMFANRTLVANHDGTQRAVNFWRGETVSCFICHKREDDGRIGGVFNNNQPPVVTDATLETPVDTPGAITLGATDGNGNTMTLRIVRQPQHGTVGLTGPIATYHPEPGFTGPDNFSFAAFDGFAESNLGTISVTVGGAETLVADSDGDGLNDVTEYGLGLSQFFPSKTGPEVTIEPDGAHDYLTLTTPTWFRPADATLAVDVSGELETWYGDTAHTTILVDTPFELKVRDNVPVDSASRRFMRLRVIRP